MHPVTALVLAGGRATRFGGVDKRELVIEGRTIFERQVEVLAPRVAEIIVSLPAGAESTASPGLPGRAAPRSGAESTASPGLPGRAAPRSGAQSINARHRTVADAIADVGPLAGIAAGLRAARTPWVLVVAGDMPNVSGAVVDLVLAHIRDDLDAIGIKVGELPEPLFCALAREAALAVVERRITAGQRKASRLLEDGELRVGWVTEAALRAVDPELRSLANVNAPEDLRSW